MNEKIRIRIDHYQKVGDDFLFEGGFRMFTGLVKYQGKILRLSPNSEGMLIEILCPEIMTEIKVDDSVSVNVCVKLSFLIMNSLSLSKQYTQL